MSKPTANAESIRGNLHPQFPGPIGKPKAGKQARFSWRNPDGSRGWHTRELASTVGDAQAKAITGAGQ